MLLKGKKGIIFGVANKRSIAWSIYNCLKKQGAELALSYLGERTKQTLEDLTEGDNIPLYECDVTKQETVEKTFSLLEKDFGKIDFLIHSLAFADRNDLKGNFSDTSKDGFLLACNVSAHSLINLTKYAKKLMPDGGSIVTLSYLGSEKIVTNYNVMGVAKSALESSVRYLANELGKNNIRVNAISAGPINTLAARGIGNFSKILQLHKKIAPLKRNTTPEEVGDTAAFLCSDMSRGITSELIYVDGGFSHIGVGPLEAYNQE